MLPCQQKRCRGQHFSPPSNYINDVWRRGHTTDVPNHLACVRILNSTYICTIGGVHLPGTPSVDMLLVVWIVPRHQYILSVAPYWWRRVDTPQRWFWACHHLHFFCTSDAPGLSEADYPVASNHCFVAVFISQCSNLYTPLSRPNLFCAEINFIQSMM